MEPIQTDVVVVGAGPGGYAAAFYAADSGKKVILVEHGKVGGVCLNQGCIPSKALLHATKLIKETRESDFRGISFAEPKIDLDKMRAWKESILARLRQGVESLASRRHVELIRGRGYFEESRLLRVETEEGQKFIKYEKAIVATGSLPAMPAAFDLGNKRIMTSTEALEVEEIPENLLIVGGGYIGMELGTVYATLGSQVVVVEALGQILTGADPDLARPVVKYARDNFKEVRLNTKVLKMVTARKQISVVMDLNGEKKEELYDRVLVSVGRKPNTREIGLENTRVELDEKGYIKVDDKQLTGDPSIYAIGDAAGGLLLAHKAHKEARIAVETLMGRTTAADDFVIPAVVFTDPEVAWCGLSENEARERNIPVEVVRFPWSASGRAMTFDRTDGLTKLIVQSETNRILGVGIVGHGAGELISEGVLAVEMGASVEDLAECVHPHPTLTETIMEAADMYFGHATHAMSRPRKKEETET